MRPEGLCQLKIPMTPPGIEPATFRLVTLCPNQLPNRVSPFTNRCLKLFLQGVLRSGHGAKISESKLSTSPYTAIQNGGSVYTCPLQFLLYPRLL